MTAPSGSSLQFGWGFEERNAIYDPAKLVNFIRPKSVSGLVTTRTSERVENIDPSRQTLKSIQLKAAVAPKVEFQPDANSIPRLMAHFCDKMPDITEPADGIFEWVNTPREAVDTVNARYISSIFTEATDGDGYPIVQSGLKARSINIKIASNKVQNMSVDFAGCYDSYTSDVTVLSAPADYDGEPIFRGHWDQSKIATGKIKVTAGAGAGFVGKVKVTTGVVAYGATELTVPAFDTPVEVRLSSDGSRLGISRKESLWVIFPSTSPASTLTTNDEWSFTAQRTLATPTYSTLDPFDAVGVEILMGGDSFNLHDLNITLTNPREPYFPVGTKYATSVQDGDKIMATLAINRQREDRDMLKRIISNEMFSALVTMYGNPLSAAYDEKWILSFPNCQVTTDQRDVTTPNTLEEPITVEAARVGSTDIFTSTIVCEIEALDVADET